MTLAEKCRQQCHQVIIEQLKQARRIRDRHRMTVTPSHATERCSLCAKMAVRIEHLERKVAQ